VAGASRLLPHGNGKIRGCRFPDPPTPIGLSSRPHPCETTLASEPILDLSSLDLTRSAIPAAEIDRVLPQTGPMRMLDDVSV